MDCLHIFRLCRYGKDDKKCVKCGMKEYRDEYIKCIHCNEFQHFIDWFILEGELILFPDGEWNYLDHVIYTCIACNKISIDPEIKTELIYKLFAS